MTNEIKEVSEVENAIDAVNQVHDLKGLRAVETHIVARREYLEAEAERTR